MKIICFTCLSPILLKRLVLMLAFMVSCYASGFAQIVPERRTNQELPRQDTTRPVEQSSTSLPDSIILKSYDPRFPIASALIKDSLLSLDYSRYDPISKAGADFIYLNSLVQPAALNPILGTPYERLRPITQVEHPTYRNLNAPFFSQNIPFSYVAYNQGGEIDDGQVDVLLGRTFANGWKLSFKYHRTYNSGNLNSYPDAAGERIYLGGSLAYVPDSSRHRAYASMVLRSKGFFNSGGYEFASDETISVPEDPFDAVSKLSNVIRTKGQSRRFNYLHRVFLNRQLDEKPKGFAAALDLSYTSRDLRNSAAFSSQTAFQADSAFYGIYSIDDRGVRYEVNSKAVLAEADLEYFASTDGELPVAFNFRGGIYGGSQRLEALHEPTVRSQVLFGLTGQVKGTILNRFTLDARTDIALGERIGEGIIEGSLAWTIADRLRLSGDILLERSAAPLATEFLGINSQLIRTTNLSVSTHSRIGSSAQFLPMALDVKGYLDVFSNAIVYSDNGIPENVPSEIAIPTLEYSLPVDFGPFTFVSRGVLRNPVQSQFVRLPGYTGQHSLFGKATVFKGSMDLLAGVDSWVRSPVKRYGYFPLTSVFFLEPNAGESDWQYSLDFFLAFKVKAFKAFARVDRILVNDQEELPATVEGYPIARSEALLPTGAILRLGVSFFLFD